jgi:hypothetical protein
MIRLQDIPAHAFQIFPEKDHSFSKPELTHTTWSRKELTEDQPGEIPDN